LAGRFAGRRREVVDVGAGLKGHQAMHCAPAVVLLTCGERSRRSWALSMQSYTKMRGSRPR